ncbi:unnamed protein product, partial [Prorocentrum cordatum]
MIHLLQKRSVLPSLQDLAAARGEPAREVAGIDCQFCSDPDAVNEEVERLRRMPRPGGGAESAGALLIAFFRHFGCDYRGGLIAIRQPEEAVLESTAAARFYFVDNPFEAA